MEQIRKIDIHAHVSAFQQYAIAEPSTNLTMVSADELFLFYDKLNIEKGVLLPSISPEHRCEYRSNEATKWLTDSYPDKFAWFCNIDPRACENTPDADLSFLIDHYKKHGAKGVGEVTASLYADDPKMDNLFYHCEKMKMPVTIHIAPKISGYHGIVDDIGLPRLEKMLKKHPDLLILGHSQPFWAEISECSEEQRNSYSSGKVKEGKLPKLLREYQNLHCDLSGKSAANALMRDRDYAARFIEEFADRLYYGCNICAKTNTHPFAFDEFLTDMRCKGEISEANYKKIVRENSIRLLNM